ncbi:DnaJ family domain-containing protein [Bacillus benzoevorans]|uniref:DnaJ homologue subfamily C member 28 conserved domain-containing protein n=1 Tax=Bacillus benzoevorans TaxID=1456 RepID=A0A7X0LXD1_9BACI|nr:DUF1992 domain-containing protein [Bacillus benzoevorans]MBB6446397.1 hypothetical protein [Bacillus benzoevorans]
MYYYFVEEKIKKAVEDGEFDHLPGKGKPLDLTDDMPGLSPELKMVYKVLKNAGYLTETKDTEQEKITFKDLYTSATDGHVQANYQKRMEFYEMIKNRKLNRNKTFHSYAEKIFKKFF